MLFASVLRCAAIALLIGSCVTSKTYSPPPPSEPRLRLPLNDAYQGSVHGKQLRPRFAWDAPLNAGDEVTYELQYSPVATFDSNVFEATTSELFYQPEEQLPVSMEPPVGARYFWRVRACGEGGCSDYSRIRWINLGRSRNDLNGDGFDDVAIGSPFPDDNLFNGEVSIYLGSASGVDPNIDGKLFGRPGLGFGASISPAGDFDGDGFADLLVGAPRDASSGLETGLAFLYFGNKGTTFTGTRVFPLIPASSDLRYGSSVATAGDVDGDGFSDVLVGVEDAGMAQLIFGGPVRRQPIRLAGPVGDRSGTVVVPGGDINGDGYSDILLSPVPASADPRACAISVFLGSPSFQAGVGRDGAIPGVAGVQCNLVAKGTGDFNGDGYSDVIAKTNSPGPGISVFLGGEHVATQRDVFIPAGGTRSAAAIGDVNGDGAEDVAVGDELASNNASVQVHFGRLGASKEVLPMTPAGTIRNNSASDNLFGFSLQGAGDVNGDGFDDVIIGDPIELDAELYLGGSGTTFNSDRDQTFFGTAQFGYAVASARLPTRATAPLLSSAGAPSASRASARRSRPEPRRGRGTAKDR